MLLAVLAAGSTTATLLATRFGPGLSPDSVRYLSAGQHLARGQGLVDQGMNPLTVFAPGLPILIAGAETLGISGEGFVRVLNAFAFGVLVVVTYVVARAVRLRDVTALSAAGFVAISPALLVIASMAWTEPVFLVAAAVTLLEQIRVVQLRRLTMRSALVMVAAAWIAFSFRYAGLELVASDLLVATFVVRPWGSLRRAGQLVGFAGALGVLPAVIVARNYSITGTPFGRRQDSTDTIRFVLSRLIATLREWVAPGPLLAGMHYVVLVGGPLLVAVAATWWLARRRSNSDGLGLESLRALGVVWVFIGLYVAYVVYAQLSTVLDPLNSRLLSPIYVPLCVLMAASVEIGLRRFRGRSLLVAAIVVTVVFFAGIQANVTATKIAELRADGLGWNRQVVNESSVARGARSLATQQELQDGETLVLSNNDMVLYSASNMMPTYSVPLTREYRGPDVEDPLARLTRQIDKASGDVYLVWFDDLGLGNLVSLEQIKSAADLEVLRSYDDGVIYTVTSRRSS